MFNWFKTHAKLLAVIAASLGASAAAANIFQANDDWITRFAVQTASGHEIPVGAFGVFVVERPREATLLHLRGKAGHGEVILRGDHGRECLSFQARFAAGDFGGDSIGGHLADPIKVVLQSRRVARALARGHEVVSDSYRVTVLPHVHADIVLAEGLGDSFGFVINPGRNLMGDIFGARTQRVACRPMS